MANERPRPLINDSEKDPSDNVKVLGIPWDNQEDKLILGVSEIFAKAEDVNPTRRNILRVIAIIYDPVGYLAPVINLKLLFQEICHLGIKLDEHIGSLETQWLHIIDLLKKSKNLCVDRCYFVRYIKDPAQYFILHSFSDASNNAYGAVIYLQTITRSGNVNLSFVTAKSRVTPLKGKFTIHRLELLGNLVLSNLIRAVNSALIEEVKIHDYFCWSLYVGFAIRNRNLKRLCKIEKWNYVPTNENPADIITRFNNKELYANHVWLNGPNDILCASQPIN